MSSPGIDQYGNLTWPTANPVTPGTATPTTFTGGYVPPSPVVAGPGAYTNWNRAWNQPYSERGGPFGAGPAAQQNQISMIPPSLPTVLPPVPATTAPPYAGQLNPAIQELITPGLVPDILRQSAETAAGRGIDGGSPAGYSTAVRMSEQNYLQRLGLANTLMGGEAGRQLPYDITPSQARELALKQAELDLQRQIAELNSRTQLEINRRNVNRLPSVPGVSGGGGFRPSSGGSMLGDFGGSSSVYGTGYGSPGTSGPSGLGRTPTTLDEVYDWLGFGDFGSYPGDVSGGFPDFGGSGYTGYDVSDFGSDSLFE